MELKSVDLNNMTCMVMIHAKVEVQVQVDAASEGKPGKGGREGASERGDCDGRWRRRTQQWRRQRRWTREVEGTTMDHTAAVAAALDAGGDSTRMRYGRGS